MSKVTARNQYNVGRIKIMLIPLTRGLFATVDDDMEWLLEYKWRAQKTRAIGVYYSSTGQTRNGDFMQMHRLIMKAPEVLQVDHKNGNTLDNRRDNLRLATNAQNARASRKKTKEMTSRFRGVYFHNEGKFWCAKYALNGKNIHIGSFDTELEAAIAWNKATQAAGFLPESQNKIPE